MEERELDRLDRAAPNVRHVEFQHEVVVYRKDQGVVDAGARPRVILGGCHDVARFLVGDDAWEKWRVCWFQGKEFTRRSGMKDLG